MPIKHKVGFMSMNWLFMAGISGIEKDMVWSDSFVLSSHSTRLVYVRRVGCLGRICFILAILLSKLRIFRKAWKSRWCGRPDIRVWLLVRKWRSLDVEFRPRRGKVMILRCFGLGSAVFSATWVGSIPSNSLGASIVLAVCKYQDIG